MRCATACLQARDLGRLDLVREVHLGVVGVGPEERDEVGERQSERLVADEVLAGVFLVPLEHALDLVFGEQLHRGEGVRRRVGTRDRTSVPVAGLVESGSPARAEGATQSDCRRRQGDRADGGKRASLGTTGGRSIALARLGCGLDRPDLSRGSTGVRLRHRRWRKRCPAPRATRRKTCRVGDDQWWLLPRPGRSGLTSERLLSPSRSLSDRLRHGSERNEALPSTVAVRAPR